MGTPKTDPDYEHSEAALREKYGRSLIERMTRWLDGSVEYRSTELIQEAVEELQALGMALQMTGDIPGAWSSQELRRVPEVAPSGRAAA